MFQGEPCLLAAPPCPASLRLLPQAPEKPSLGAGAARRLVPCPAPVQAGSAFAAAL